MLQMHDLALCDARARSHAKAIDPNEVGIADLAYVPTQVTAGSTWSFTAITAVAAPVASTYDHNNLVQTCLDNMTE